MQKELEKVYEPQKFEDAIYRTWEKSGFFNPDKLSGKRTKPFTISMPPPNATGILHIGHALMLSYQDILIRFERMRGKKTLWLPGEDHAALATNAVIERELSKEGTTKHALGRREFLERVTAFVADSRRTIQKQIRKMGSSCDWSRERYTLDEGLSHAVRVMFKKMYDDGLIYRGDRIVNWCVQCESTISDDEVTYRKETGKLFYIQYGPFTIATVRPETKFGDTGIAVHPQDKRYQRYVGKTVEAEDVLGKITLMVVADPLVDPAFGTGAVKVTPAHDFIDFEIGKRHNLPLRQVIGKDGRLNELTGTYRGLTTAEARTTVARDLKKKGLLEREEEHEHNVATCGRCGTTIEPLIALQWFVAVDKKITLTGNRYFKNKSLKDVARAVVKDGEISIIPKRFEKIYFQWMDTLHDWCISRQIWFGHRIPVWYKGVESEKAKVKRRQVYVGVEKPAGKVWEQDPDTLDTWFSSGIWTFSTLGWPERTKDLQTFHPTDVLETGHEIIFTWVARMILMTTYALGEIPFRYVYLHGMVQDKLGRKMSKSLGNGIDPIDMIEKFGADALRLSMVVGGSPGNAMRLYEEKIAGFRNFVNKLWNIARYILGTVQNPRVVLNEPKPKTLADRWILERLRDVTAVLTSDIENFNFSKGAEELRRFTWEDLADWYLEAAKVEGNKDEMLLFILSRILVLWHPYTPFVTEVIWGYMHGKNEGLLMIQPWPKAVVAKKEKAAEDWSVIQTLIQSIRKLRSFYAVPNTETLALFLEVSKDETLFVNEKKIIEKFARVRLERMAKKLTEIPKKSLHLAVSGKTTGLARAYLPIEGILDIVEEKKRLERELGALTARRERLAQKLADEQFVKRAPTSVVAEERRKLAEIELTITQYDEQRKVLASLVNGTNSNR